MTLFKHPRYRPIIGAILAVLAGMLIMALVWLLFAIRITQVERVSAGDQTLQAAEDASRAAKAAERGTDVILDCTQAGVTCFEENQLRTSELIERLVFTSIYAAACADPPGYQTDAEIKRCVLDKIARQDPGE